MTDRTTYLATIFYTDTDGGSHTLMGLIMAVDVDDAMQAIISEVSARPNCEQVIGGVIEPADAELLAAIANAAEHPNAQAGERQWDGTAEHARVLNARAPGTTVH